MRQESNVNRNVLDSISPTAGRYFMISNKFSHKMSASTVHYIWQEKRVRKRTGLGI